MSKDEREALLEQLESLKYEVLKKSDRKYEVGETNASQALDEVLDAVKRVIRYVKDDYRFS